MSLRELSLLEKTDAQRLAAAAAAVGQQALGKLTLQAAQAVLATLAKVAEAPPARRAAALRALRSDGNLRMRSALDVAEAGRTARDLLQRALEAGFRFDLVERAKVVEAESRGLTLRVEVTAEDLKGLAGYPIQGNTVDEIAGHLAARLRFELDGALGQTLGGDPSGVVPALGAVAQAHAGRLAEAVRAAYFAGVQAATRQLAAALTGRGRAA